VIEIHSRPATDGAEVVAVGFGGDLALDQQVLDQQVVHALGRGASPAAALADFLADGPPLKAGEVRSLPLPGQVPKRILALGLGAGTPADLRLAGAALARAGGEPELVAVIPGLSGERLSAFVEGLSLGPHRFTRATKPTSAKQLARVTLVGPEYEAAGGRAAIDRGRQSAQAVAWVRELANTRSSIKTPQWLAQQAVAELTPLGVEVLVREPQWLAEHGFGGVLAVGSGAGAPPRLVQANWRPRGSARGPHLVIVGKGITFDTGGLNLKPGSSMNTMFTDMAGGAAALGALRIVAQRRLPIRVTVLVPIAENSLSGSAMRPSDVIRHYGGRTSEVGNTDAEGRLVLADALAYAVDRLAPTAIVDIATLTGAMMVALGSRIAGVLSTSDELAAQLEAAGTAVDEPLWRMPLTQDYEQQLHSDVADAQNAPGNPGGITAALFLRHFVGDVPWAHLDIAGPSHTGKDHGINPKGATGFGTRLLADWIEQVSAS
jgi:leucyl aminopeptidase